MPITGQADLNRRILGVDPGSRITGFGVIDIFKGKSTYVASGCIRTEGGSLPERLRVIYLELQEVVQRYQPEEMAIEQVFMHRNADSALKLGQARGAAIASVVTGGIPVSEYTPRQIKQAIVGTGGGSKDQIQHMVSVLLELNAKPQADAADALAVALCHGHMQQTMIKVNGVSGIARGRWR